ncbi:OVARIAN TUMOR DOMAIN-containing deubiquitinating enzyme 12-like [Prosopis cineraria]|uniref:OVARIAN TUMOR DOMAIN-containing deubiquitinating enzyme 12-like n=1 Tax=Prosopis cineraria TaxID=364024 RepID=UPI00240EBB17|nr:OVARIAN TUMOR DOMAIN-containing deubiquitinating enzyme 12-like [Prosopis cineraria]
MISYEQDPDVVRWGLQLFYASPYSNCRYCGAVTQENSDCYHGYYFREEDYNNDFTNIDNDEQTVHALQQQFSQLAVTEPSEPSYDWSENMPPSNSLQEWLSHPIDSYCPEQQHDQEEADDPETSGSYSSSEKNLYCGDQWLCSLEQIDEYALDGEVGKRLNQMVPIPHVPRINGEIPSIDEATLDHQRLLHRLQLYELVESKVEGDGNCQFRALSDQIYRTPEHHIFVREQVVNQLKSYPDIYEGYVPMAYRDYLEKMTKNGEWGDHVTLQAAADFYGVKIFVITSFKDTCYIEILPNFERSRRVICLSFWAEVHYNSIYPEGGPQNEM